MDARRCISYLTIELRTSIPEELREPMGRHVFGCDICQDVCPWNRRAPIAITQEFQPRIFSPDESNRAGTSPPPASESLLFPRLEWLASLSEPEFRELFRDSPIKRAKWRGLVRNACIALGNSALPLGSSIHTRVTQLLSRLAASPEAVIAESAQWALSRIQQTEESSARTGPGPASNTRSV
jgi:epoxyqueuosine reductase